LGEAGDISLVLSIAAGVSTGSRSVAEPVLVSFGGFHRQAVPGSPAAARGATPSRSLLAVWLGTPTPASRSAILHDRRARAAAASMRVLVGDGIRCGRATRYPLAIHAKNSPATEAAPISPLVASHAIPCARSQT